MANVTIPANTAVDLYTASSIPPGTQITVTNITTGDVRLSVSEAGVDDDYIVLNAYEQAINTAGDTEAYAFSVGGGAVNVKES